MSAKINDKVVVPACLLRMDGNTYPHREALKKAGWKFDGKYNHWTKEHKGGTLTLREGVRIVADSGGVGCLWNDTHGKNRAPAIGAYGGRAGELTRDDFDGNYDT